MPRLSPEDYLASLGLPVSGLAALEADASSRRYFRLVGTARPLLLMDSGPEPLVPFVTVARHLRSLGLRAPEILRHDRQNGYALIEDFGDGTFSRLLAKGEGEARLYQGAAEVLAFLHNHPGTTAIDVAAYDLAELMREVRLFTDWYLGVGDRPSGGAILDAFASVLRGVSTRRETLVLKDFHVDNLMLCPKEQTGEQTGEQTREQTAEKTEAETGEKAGEAQADWLRRLGLLDFQDGLIGAAAYDVVSLLEDARRDVSGTARQRFFDIYLARRQAFDRDQFMRDYALLGAQRHAKVLGIFRRLQKRDNKPVYIQHLPRVARLLQQALAHPALTPVRESLARHAPDWACHSA